MASVDSCTVAGRDAAQQVAVLDALLADVTALRNAVLALTAKLDADGDVVVNDFAATCDPAALTTTT